MNDDSTLWVGNLSSRITEDILYELFLQAGPLKKVTLPKDNLGDPRPYAFVTYKYECSVVYAAALFSQTKLFGRLLRIRPNNKCSQLQMFHMPVEEDPIPEPTSWKELNALENKASMDMPIAMNQGLPVVPDFNMLLQMGNQMMFPMGAPIGNMPVGAMPGMNFGPYMGGPMNGYPSQQEDMYGNRSRDHRSSHHHHPYERDRHRDSRDHVDRHRDHGYSNYHNRESSSSSSHHYRERRDRRY